MISEDRELINLLVRLYIITEWETYARPKYNMVTHQISHSSH